MSIPQRAYVYLASFVAFAILLQGAYGLATDILTLETLDMATWMAMIIVGLPVWLAHDFLVRRAAARHPDEASSALRKLYVHGALALAALYVFIGAMYVVQGLVGDVDGGLENIGGIIAAAGLWYYLWRRENLEGQPGARAQTVKRWRVYGLSLIFLSTAVAGAYWITYGLAYATYNLIFDADVLVGAEDFQDPLRTAAGWALVGVAAWAVQWRAVADGDEESVLRQVYLYGFAFIGAALLSLWAASATIYVVIAKLVGADDTVTTVAYVRQFILPGVGLLIGLAILGYHWSIIRRDAARRAPAHPEPAEGAPTLSAPFKYIMSAVGLIALVPGLMGLLFTILMLLTDQDVLNTAGGDAEFLAVSLTMVIVGAPLWVAFWWRVVKADPRSLIRRIYLYVALIVLGGTWLFTLTALLAAVLTEILGQGSGFLDEALIPTLSIIIPAAGFFAYHVLILREDSRRAPPVVPDAEPVILSAVEEPAYYIVPAPPYVVPKDSRLRP